MEPIEISQKISDNAQKYKGTAKIDIEKLGAEMIKDFVNKKLNIILEQIEFAYHPDDQSHKTKDIERIIKSELL